jgi:hypothetical protein
MKTINLTQGKVAIVDDKDFDKVKNLKWFHHFGYAKRNFFINKKWVIISMHRLILGLGRGDVRQVDHINGNGLDNRRKNLRLCTNSQNQMNKIVNNKYGYKGIFKTNRPKKWGVRIYKNKKRFTIGYFYEKIEAAKAYNEAAKKYYGEYACLNKV